MHYRLGYEDPVEGVTMYCRQGPGACGVLYTDGQLIETLVGYGPDYVNGNGNGLGARQLGRAMLRGYLPRPRQH